MTAFSNTRIVLLVLLVFNSLLVMVVLNNTAILMRISGTGDHDAHLLRHTELEYKTFINQIRQLPVIFVGGHFRSGTTLMRGTLFSLSVIIILIKLIIKLFWTYILT